MTQSLKQSIDENRLSLQDLPSRVGDTEPSRAAWGTIFYKWLLDDRDRAKASDEERFQRLSARVAYLERKIETLDR
jgi:hypothetical protein